MARCVSERSSVHTACRVCLLFCPIAGSVRALRTLLKGTKVKDWSKFRPHDLRRGHAEDLRKAGAPLWKILAAGEWTSGHYKDYIDVHQAEMEAVLQGVLEDESDDECIPGECEDLFAEDALPASAV